MNVFSNVVKTPLSWVLKGWLPVIGATVLVFQIAAVDTVQAQSTDGETTAPVEVVDNLDETPASTVDPQAVAQFEVSIQALIDANTDPQNLPAELADFIATECVGGTNCAAVATAALNLAAVTTPPETGANPIAGAIGSALAQVANATRETQPEIAQTIEIEIARAPTGADGALTSFNAVASLETPDTVATATVGTPASGG